jgi:hypothetical protein
LTAATMVTLVLVPVMYSICVLDLRIIRWDRPAKEPAHELIEVASR